MIGTEKALINKICETMTPTQALLEFIDNPIDKKAKNIYVNFDENGDFIKIYNDGEPFNNIEDYLREFISNFKHEIGDIGSMNQGSKQAAACLLDNRVGRMRIFSPVVDKSYCIYGEINFNITNKETSIDSRCEHLLYEDDEFRKYNNLYGVKKNGVTFVLEYLKENVKNEKDNLYKECSKRYGKRNLTQKINIYINDEKVKFEDPLFLKILGDDINKDGIYKKDGIIFSVKTYYFTYNGQEKRQFKAVLTYLPRARYEKVDDIPGYIRMLDSVGVYTFLGDRIMDCGGNTSEMFGYDFDSYLCNAGGTDRVRFGIFCDGNADIFQISSNKSQGIKKLCQNNLLKEKCISLEKRNIEERDGTNGNKKRNSKKVLKNHSIYNELLNDFYSFEKMNRYESSNDGTINTLTLDIVKKFTDGIKPRQKRTITNLTSDIKKSDIIKSENDLSEVFLLEKLKEIKTIEGQNIFKSFYLCTRNKIKEDKTRQIMEEVIKMLKQTYYEEGNQIHRGTEAA